MKEKIAISLNPDIVKEVDALIDGTAIRSRSQAIEVLVRRGIDSGDVREAVIMVSSEHRATPLRQFKKTTLLAEQVQFLRANGIESVIVLSPERIDVPYPNIVAKERHNGDALRAAQSATTGDFAVLGGDIYASFDLRDMIRKHHASRKLATIALMSAETPSKYGTAIMEGDLVVAFQEKPKAPKSHIVNAGIYVFSRGIFKYLRGSLERDVLPELARRRELVGYVTMGEYVHFFPEGSGRPASRPHA